MIVSVTFYGNRKKLKKSDTSDGMNRSSMPDASDEKDLSNQNMVVKKRVQQEADFCGNRSD